MKILWLASWYPTPNDPLTGDFIQRHAQAASMHHSIHLIHVKRDDAIEGYLQKTIVTNGNLTEAITLYRPRIKLFGRIGSVFIWLRLLLTEIKNWIKENGMPSLIHAHVAWRCGLIARYYHRRKKIPYFITEHYTGYFNEAKHLIPTYNLVQHFLLKNVFQHAAKIQTVSNALAAVLRERYQISATIIPNVIDISIFKPLNENKETMFTMLHVSTLTFQKDPDTLFKACFRLYQEGFPFKLWLIAPKDKSELYRRKYNEIADCIDIIEETDQVQLAGIMQKAQVLIMPSLFESFGLVLYESIACGTPVIASNIAVFKEYDAAQSFISYFEMGNVQQLTSTIKSFAATKNNFDVAEMNNIIEKSFSIKKVAEKFDRLYNDVQL